MATNQRHGEISRNHASKPVTGKQGARERKGVERQHRGDPQKAETERKLRTAIAELGLLRARMIINAFAAEGGTFAGAVEPQLDSRLPPKAPAVATQS